MDYTAQTLGFKLRKTLRYVRLYGPRRTLVKVRGRYHARRRYPTLPRLASPPPAGGHVGLVGCGNFAYSTIAYYLRKNYGRVMRAAMDVDLHRAASLYDDYGLRYYTDRIDPLLDDPEIDLLFIASNHASHAEYAIRALAAGKHVHIEKPHVVDGGQLRRLCRAMRESPGRVTLGFNRPGSRFGALIRRHLESQQGPAMLDWFVAGHELPPDHWYLREEEGGRVLGNLCHWTDFLLQLVPRERRYPIVVNPTRGVQPDCDIVVTYLFGDGSIGSITFSDFSGKGHAFEGVRETFAAHRGNVLLSMRDFKELTAEVVERRTRYRNRFRDHGHEALVRRSYAMARPGRGEPPCCGTEYVWETADLFLKTREALAADRRVACEPFDESSLGAAGGPRGSEAAAGRG